MTTTIFSFMAIGIIFGWLTHSRQHLFSEGPSKKGQHADAQEGLQGKILWVLICTLLWPVMALSGLYSLWRWYMAQHR